MMVMLASLLLLNFAGSSCEPGFAATHKQSIKSIEKKLSFREREMLHLKTRLERNRKRLKLYRGKRLKLKVKILNLRVKVDEYHLKIEKLHIKEIQDRRAIRRLEKAIAHLDEVIDADLQQKGSLESRLLNHQAEIALSRIDGTDISPVAVTRSYLLSRQTEQLDKLVSDYKHKKRRLNKNQRLLFDIRNHEVHLLKKRETQEAGLKKDMGTIQEKIVVLKKREQSINDDNRSIQKRRRKLANLITKLERMKRMSHRHEIYSHPPIPGHSMFHWPVKGRVVEKYGRFHDGIDIAARVGSPVHAAWSGKILFARAYSGYGRLVIIEHGNHLYTLYGHLDRIYASEGQEIQAGGVIGTIGQGGTQGRSTLFFGVTRHGRPLSPMEFLKH